jgi:hypothetical protein
LLHVGYDDAEEWKVIVSSDEDDTQLVIPFAVSYLLGSTRRAKTADQASSEFDRGGRNCTTVTTGTNRMRRSILILAAAIALSAAIMNTGATAAYGRGRHWVSDHFRSDFGHRAFRRGDQRHRFAPSLEPWDWGGG